MDLKLELKGVPVAVAGCVSASLVSALNEFMRSTDDLLAFSILSVLSVLGRLKPNLSDRADFFSEMVGDRIELAMPESVMDWLWLEPTLQEADSVDSDGDGEPFSNFSTGTLVLVLVLVLVLGLVLQGSSVRGVVFNEWPLIKLLERISELASSLDG